ncbi:hypothetical protein [Paenibacillus elgii]|uniref:hypothetical protein n=1 Tax=Paenibacillus elgii TaxID=189691 RepID=UPI0013D672E0|nr:hypothetical protein [Paenibacillus elgii]
MENFISTIVFLLPGFLMYFWIQSFGVNPVVKHSPTEMGAISALLWLPVSATTLLVYNLIIIIAGRMAALRPIWDLDDLKKGSGSLFFLVSFLTLSVVISFLMGAIWAKWGEPLQRKMINKIRRWRGAAEFSKNASVWDEIFLANEPQVVEIGKIDKDESGMIGCIDKVSRSFETERLSLNDVEYFTSLVKKYCIPVSNIYLDVKAGIYIKIFDPEKIKSAQLSQPEDECSISSSEVEGSE